MSPAAIQDVLMALTVVVICLLVAAAVGLTAMWRVYAKADVHGWAALIPIYNIVVLLRIALRSPYWVLLAVPTFAAVAELRDPLMLLREPGLYGLLTLASLAAGLALSVVSGTGIAVAFHRGSVFGVLALGLVPIVGYSILGFGRARCLPSQQRHNRPHRPYGCSSWPSRLTQVRDHASSAPAATGWP